MDRNTFIMQSLEIPDGELETVLDTDTYNEVDDQFALSYLIKSTGRIKLAAVYAAPFFNANSSSPADGMEKSYNEILKIEELCGRPDLKGTSFRGADRYLPNENTPVDSDAARDLIARAKAMPDGKKLYVVAIACITNISSALLLAPEIADKIVVIWLGGHGYDWPDTNEFNMAQDIAATRVLFNSGVPVVQVPCMNMASSMTISGPEINEWLIGHGKLATYLGETVLKSVATYINGAKVWTRIIWDLCAAAYLVNPQFAITKVSQVPSVSYDKHYGINPAGHVMKYITYMNRDAVMSDMIAKVTE